MISRNYPAWLRRGARGADEATIDKLSRAMAAKDDEAIRHLLHRAVTVVIDSGGHLNTASIPLNGRAAATSELVSLMSAGTTTATASINSVPGITLLREDRVVGVITADFRSGRLSSVWVVCNPEKLRHWNR